MNNKQIEEVLESWDGCHGAEAPDFFYTRLRAKMQAQSDTVQTPLPAFLKPVWVMTAFLLLLIINILVIAKNDNNDNNDDNSLASSNDNVHVIASEYNMPDAVSFYDASPDK